jgi:transcription elongation factor Elf1
MLIRLYATHSFTDFNCPHCNASILVEWTTEYKDAVGGDYSKDCPLCRKPIKFNVKIDIKYTVIK